MNGYIPSDFLYFDADMLKRASVRAPANKDGLLNWLKYIVLRDFY